jgi:hypothetical protein
MKREIPVIITFVFGAFMIVQYFIPHPLINGIATTLQGWAIIVIAFSYVLGSVNILRINGEQVYRRHRDWPYKLVLIGGFLLMLITGLVGGIEQGSFANDRLFMQIYIPMSATMYSTLAFFIASAAFRAFRIRTWQAAILAVTAVAVMLGRVPIGQLLWKQFPDFVDWVMNVPNAVAQRGILIGAALGAIATGLKVVFGIERSYLGHD